MRVWTPVDLFFYLYRITKSSQCINDVMFYNCSNTSLSFHVWFDLLTEKTLNDCDRWDRDFEESWRKWWSPLHHSLCPCWLHCCPEESCRQTPGSPAASFYLPAASLSWRLWHAGGSRSLPQPTVQLQAVDFTLTPSTGSTVELLSNKN